MIKAIIFDYGNVISRVDHSLFLKRIASLSAHPLSALQKMASGQPKLLVDYENGWITSAEFYRDAVEKYGLAISQTDFRNAFIDIFERIQPTIQLIKQLKPRYKIGLLSNTNEWHYEAQIKTVEVFPLFDTITTSFEVGAMKPDEKIYRDALGKLALPPDTCMYIDDIGEYVEAAQRVGMHAVQYTTPDALLLALKTAGVNV